MHSANPPGPLSKQKGTRTRAPGGNWRCKKGAAAVAQIAVISVSNSGMTWATFSLTPPGPWAQTPLLIPSAAPGRPVTRQTQLLPFTKEQALPTAVLPALLRPTATCRPCSDPQEEALLAALPPKATDTDVQGLCYVKEKRRHQPWCQGLMGTRPLETLVIQTQLPLPSLQHPSLLLILFTAPAEPAARCILPCHVSQPRKAKQPSV